MGRKFKAGGRKLLKRPFETRNFAKAKKRFGGKTIRDIRFRVG
jgi:hypothetical protein